MNGSGVATTPPPYLSFSEQYKLVPICISVSIVDIAVKKKLLELISFLPDNCN